MACSSRLRVQGNPIRHKNPSNDSKPWIYDEKYSVFKFLTRGDDGHSANGLKLGLDYASTKSLASRMFKPSCSNSISESFALVNAVVSIESKEISMTKL